MAVGRADEERYTQPPMRDQMRRSAAKRVSVPVMHGRGAACVLIDIHFNNAGGVLFGVRDTFRH
jgi:hypothetical protein